MVAWSVEGATTVCKTTESPRNARYSTIYDNFSLLPQKCGVLAAWEGEKIEKVNDLRLCFICSFREKRKASTSGKSSKKNEKADKENAKVKEKEDKEKKEDPQQRFLMMAPISAYSFI